MTEELMNKMIKVTDKGHSSYNQVGKIIRCTSKSKNIVYLVHMTVSNSKIYLKLNQFKVKG